MRHRFPVTVVDGFYKNPKEVVKLANSFEYIPSRGSFPGTRTRPLDEVDNKFYQYCAGKFLSAYFDFSVVGAQFKVLTQFQKVKDFGKDYLNQGWIHKDKGMLCAGVIYLDETADPNSGTSIYEPIVDEADIDAQEEKLKLYAQGIEIDSYKEKLDKNNEQFVESIRVQNKFNRLIAYDTEYPHGAKSHGTKHGERLTHTFFVKELGTSHGNWPEQRFESAERNSLTDCI